MDVEFSVCILMREAVGARVWEVGVFRDADVVCLCTSCVLNAVFCITCSLSRVEEADSGTGLMNAL